jgi:hypothetical protein
LIFPSEEEKRGRKEGKEGGRIKEGGREREREKGRELIKLLSELNGVVNENSLWGRSFGDVLLSL